MREIEPAATLAPDPVVKTIEPVPPLVADPVERVKWPVVPRIPEAKKSAVTIEIEPLELEVLPPEDRRREPPPTSPCPAVSVMDPPPPPERVFPTTSEIALVGVVYDAAVDKSMVPEDADALPV